MFNFLSLINNSVTIGFSYLLLIISAIISPKTINTLRFFPRSYWVSNKSFRQNALCLLFCVCQLNIDILFRKDLFPFNIICQYQADCLLSITVKNIIISPNFPVWKFCGKAKFPHSFGRFARNYARDCAFPQNFHTMKLGEITVFYEVSIPIPFSLCPIRGMM